MQAYNSLTLNDVFDYVTTQLEPHRLPESLDWATVVRSANLAIKETIILTLAYRDWSYIRKLDVTNGSLLANEYIKHVVLLIDIDGVAREARYVDVKEYYKLTDNIWRHSWTQARNEEPVYTIWGSGKPQQTTIYFTPGTVGVFYGYFTPAFVGSPADVIPIPAEFEDYVLLSTANKVLFKIRDTNEDFTLTQQLQTERRKLIDLFNKKRETEKKELDSFISPVIPNIPPQVEPYQIARDL